MRAIWGGDLEAVLAIRLVMAFLAALLVADCVGRGLRRRALLAPPAMRSGVAVAAFTVATLLAAACSPERDWREFQWPQGGFSVLLPGKPRKEDRKVRIDNVEVPLEMLSLQTKGVAYGVGYADFPPGATAEMRARRIAAARDQLVANIAGELASDREVKLDGHSGREFRAQGKVAGEAFVTTARVYAVGDRLYEVAVVARAAQVADADPDLFLGSFKLLPKSPR